MRPSSPVRESCSSMPTPSSNVARHGTNGPSALNGCYVFATLAPPGRMPAVDREDHARCIAGAIRRQERHEIADLARMRRPAERHALLEFLVAVLVAELVFRARLQQRDVAVGAD